MQISTALLFVAVAVVVVVVVVAVVVVVVVVAGMKLVEGGCCFYGKRVKLKELLQLNHVKALVTSHEPHDWQSALSTVSQVCLLTYLLLLILGVFVILVMSHKSQDLQLALRVISVVFRLTYLL